MIKTPRGRAQLIAIFLPLAIIYIVLKGDHTLFMAIENFGMIEGLFSWMYLWLVLAQIILCKDASEARMEKLMSRPLKVRLRLFKRSIKDTWYSASCGLFLSVSVLLFGLSDDFWTNKGRAPMFVLFHALFPFCLNALYYSRGYRAIFFVKFMDFITQKD